MEIRTYLPARRAVTDGDGSLRRTDRQPVTNASPGRGAVPGGTPPLPGAFPEGRAGGFGMLSWGLAWGVRRAEGGQPADRFLPQRVEFGGVHQAWLVAVAQLVGQLGQFGAGFAGGGVAGQPGQRRVDTGG